MVVTHQAQSTNVNMPSYGFSRTMNKPSKVALFLTYTTNYNTPG